MRQLAQVVSWVGHRVREAGVHMDRAAQRHVLARIAFCVGDGNNGMSSGLRGYAMARELRNLGWRTIVLPKQLELSQRQRLVRLERPDIVVLQKSRHPLNRPRHYPGICIFDIDDADFVDPNQREGVIECMKQAARVVAGSRFVAEFARQHNPNVDVVWTGSHPRRQGLTRKRQPPVVAWAISQAGSYPDEFALVTTALAKVKSTNWQFWLFGVNDLDEGEKMVKPLEDRGIRSRILRFMKYDEFLATLEEVSIGLAPLVPLASEFSAGKSFGKVLGYLNCGVPIVASNCAEHPMFFRHGVNGFLASNATEFAESIELLLSDISLRQQVSEHAYADYVEHLSIASVARKMDALLRPLVGN